MFHILLKAAAWIAALWSFEVFAVADPTKATSWSDSYSVAGQCYCDTDYDHGLSSISVDTPKGRKSVRQVCKDIKSKFGSGASSGRLYFNTVHCGHQPRNDAKDEKVCPGIPRKAGDYTGPRCKETGATWNLNKLYGGGTDDDNSDTDNNNNNNNNNNTDDGNTDNGNTNGDSNKRDFDKNRDLISLHYDHAPDRDDAHATVAGRMVTNFFNIKPLVVSGAYGDKNKSKYNKASEAVMTATWGNNWTNAHSDRKAAVNATAATWQAVLNSGGNIYVAEGGQSDFSADVVRKINSSSNVNTKVRITIVQHSGWNQNNTSSSDLNYVKGQTNYVYIANGNFTNDTANLNEKSASFVSTARESAYTKEWEAAFKYLSPNDKLDFSDTVELLHILKIGKDRIATVDDFADEFFKAVDNSDTTTDDDSSDDNTQDTDTTADFPDCSLSIIDDNGDGYGWENNASCVITNTDTNTNNDNTQVVVTFPKCSPTIIDDNGDGYGWENNASCEITKTDNTGTVGDSTTDDNSDVAFTFPKCSPGIIDDNGDGYGWENNTSCEITKTDNTGTVGDSATDNSTDLTVTFPKCSPGIVDDNGDGYGWENNTSCEITNTDITGTVDNSTDVTVTFPKCSPGIIDDNGDGYGWEREQSCLLTTANDTDTSTNLVVPEFPACSATVQDTDGDGYAWENERTCSVGEASGNTVSVAVFANCSAGIIDSDGDGYGWENNSTCVITNTTVQDNAGLFPDCSSTVVDEDGDGYGWENDRTCVITGTTTAPVSVQLLTFAVCSEHVTDNDNDGYAWDAGATCRINGNNGSNQIAIAQFPVCSAAVVDTDSDGYGWELGSTCVFNQSGSLHTDTQNYTVLTFPTCSNSATDHDNDGYSWENGSSCTMVSGSEQSNDVILSGVAFPVCSSNSSETGVYGWENNTSCVHPNRIPDQSALAPFPACSSQIIDTDGDGYGWESNMTCVFR